MRRAMVAALLLYAAAASADVAMGWSRAAATIVVAHDGKIEGFDRTGEKRLWSATGLASPSAIVVSPDGSLAVVLDGLADLVAHVSIADGAVKLYDAPSTPVAAAFFGRDAWVVLRDRGRVRRFTPKGEQTDVELALDPAFVAVSDRFVYVYSRAEGLLQEIDPKTAELTRSVRTRSGGSDLEIRLPVGDEAGGAIAYVCLPATTGTIAVIELTKMDAHDLRVGIAPVDLAFVPSGAALWVEPGTSAIADPGRQSVFVSARPGPGVPMRPATPVDRISISGAGLFAFDTNGGTLYRIDRRNVTPVASELSPGSYAATDDALFTWDAKSRRLHRAWSAK